VLLHSGMAVTRADAGAVPEIRRRYAARCSSDQAWEACFGSYKLDRLPLRHRQFAGDMGPELSRRAVRCARDAVCVLPYDPQRGAWC
jgi:hypothetical protein